MFSRALTLFCLVILLINFVRLLFGNPPSNLYIGLLCFWTFLYLVDELAKHD